MERETVSDKLDKVITALEETQTKKKFQLPLRIRMQKGKAMKKDFAVVVLIKTNGAVQFKMLPIVDNTIKVGEVYYEATAKHVLRYKRWPMIIIPEWNITPLSQPDPEPFNAEKNYDEAINQGKLSSAEKFILHAIKMDTVKPKMNFNMKAIAIGLVVVVGGALLLGQLGVI